MLMMMQVLNLLNYSLQPDSLNWPFSLVMALFVVVAVAIRHCLPFHRLFHFQVPEIKQNNNENSFLIENKRNILRLAIKFKLQIKILMNRRRNFLIHLYTLTEHKQLTSSASSNRPNCEFFFQRCFDRHTHTHLSFLSRK